MDDWKEACSSDFDFDQGVKLDLRGSKEGERERTGEEADGSKASRLIGFSTRDVGEPEDIKEQV